MLVGCRELDERGFSRMFYNDYFEKNLICEVNALCSISGKNPFQEVAAPLSSSVG